MSKSDLERMQSIKTLPSLIAYLRDELDWPIEADEIEDVFFEYDPAELGLAPDQAAGIIEIKQLRPMDANQPWGIFWVNFEKKRLPVVMLRRILGHLVIKKRASANKAAQRTWHANDLLFISAYGEEHDRSITFAHFAQDTNSASDLPVLKVLGWDGGDTVLHLADAHRTLTEKLRWPTNPENLAAWRAQWAGVFTLRHREVISTTTELVEELAKLATSIRKCADAILSRESDRGPMRQLYGAFKTTLIHDLSEDDFADVIAQTISYGLLVARFSNKGGISIKSLVEMIPPTNPFLRELLAELLAVAGRKKGAFDFDELGIQDVVDLLNQANAEAVKSDFGNRTRNEDPIIHFYEHFLKAYDKRKKVQRGVFFTPQPIVSYIVRSVHELLQTEFSLEDGLADTTTWGEMAKRIKGLKVPDGAMPGDPFVLILDPATGTATFLVEVIEVIFIHLKKKWTDLGKKSAEICKLWNEYVPQNLLPRLYGYELMMAPYTIAHMKLALKLQEINARLGQPDFQFMYTDRAHIYLTNSLEPAGDDKQGVLEGIFPALAHEASSVNKVKKGKRFTVVIGNPPYAGISSNRTEYALRLADAYKVIDGETLEERKLWLQDDYVKFIRKAQLTIEAAHLGVLGYITNHGFVDNPTFRGMRQNLMTTFGRLFVLNLHGNTNKQERAPCGGADQNVFEIRQGVAICLGVRRASTQSVQSADLWGTRMAKYDYLAMHKGSDTGFTPLVPSSPFYLFIPHDTQLQEEYEQGWSIPDIFPVNSVGYVTARDSLTINFDREMMWHVVQRFAALPPEKAREEFELGSDARDWKVSTAQADVRKDGPDKLLITQTLYRPFDIRYTYYTGNSRGFYASPCRNVMSQMLPGGNLSLCFCRREELPVPYGHFLASRHISSFVLLSGKATGSQAPLYITVPNGSRDMLWLKEPYPNLNPSYLRTLGAVLGSQPTGDFDLPSGISPEDIFHYIYAVFHSPTYRTRYAEFLKIDFPRLPLTHSLDLFRALIKLGGELVALHLLESPRVDHFITEFMCARTPKVEKVSWTNGKVWIDKAQTTGFRGVREDVWNFHIGGYQVCEKWLKDRKGRTLSEEDISHYHKIIVALTETIRLMQEIDQIVEEHGGWPDAFKQDQN